MMPLNLYDPIIPSCIEVHPSPLLQGCLLFAKYFCDIYPTMACICLDEGLRNSGLNFVNIEII